MIVLNFSHPLTAERLAQVEALTGQAVRAAIGNRPWEACSRTSACADGGLSAQADNRRFAYQERFQPPGTHK